MYAYYEPQLYDVTFSGDKVSFSVNPLKVPYTKSSQITLTPASGYYFESISCSTGYTVSGFAFGTNHYSTQTITITNNTHVGGGTCTITMHARSYAATPEYHPKTCTGTKNCHTESGESCTCDNYCWSSAGELVCCETSCTPWSHTVCDEYQYDCSYYTYYCPNGGTLSGTTCVFS